MNAVPIILGFVGKNGKWLLLVLLILLAWYFLKPYLRRIFGGVPDDAPYFIGGGDILASFYNLRSNKANTLYKTLKKSSFANDGRCAALKEANGWNDNQLILIHNQFKNKYGTTLFNMLNDIYGDDCGLTDFGFFDSQLKDRLSTLGLV
ncbi:MAG: hypothetical protein H7246_21785 [Phycisphaerae bacterium]|nr:hypothetical protein [Saprospiraceae bacterium]